MKEQTKKEHEVYAVGRPNIENLSPNERKAFFSTLLMCVIEHYHKKDGNNIDNKNREFDK